jgi:hypothetical protein
MVIYISLYRLWHLTDLYEILYHMLNNCKAFVRELRQILISRGTIGKGLNAILNASPFSPGKYIFIYSKSP